MLEMTIGVLYLLLTKSCLTKQCDSKSLNDLKKQFCNLTPWLSNGDQSNREMFVNSNLI